MRPHLALAPILLATASCAPERTLGPTTPPAATADPAVALVAGADSVVVEIESQGCFHHVRHRLALLPDADGARVSLATTIPNLFLRDGREGPRYEAPARVDGATLARLERALDMYRAIPQDEGITCTSTIEFRIARWAGGAVTHEERIFDGTCGAFGREEAKVLHEELIVYRERGA